MNPELTRRAMLKQLSLTSGATLLSPILANIAAHAAGDAVAATPKRMVFIMQSNGMNPEHLLPSGLTRPKHGIPQNQATEEVALAGRKLHPALAPFVPFQNRLTLLQGLSGRIALGDHSCNHGALGAYPGNKGPLGKTVDVAVSEQLPGVFPHLALGYSGSSEVMSYAYSASAPGKAVPIVCSPDHAFKGVFGSVVDESSRQEFDLRSNLLDFMADDVKQARTVLVGDERQKLDRYLEAFESLRDRQAQLVAKADELRKHAPKLGDKQTASKASLILEAQFETATAALIAGLTRVVTLTSGGGNQRFGQFPEFNIPDLHGVGHGSAYGRNSSEDCFVELRVFHTKLIARMVEKLSSIPEGNGTMMDNTLIVYFSDSGEAHHPRLFEWPVVLIGNFGGKLSKTGRHLQLPTYQSSKHRTMANLFCTLLHWAGKPTDQFGVRDPGLRDIDQTGPIPELMA
ncbi:DUF1552 domain-containing protein [Tuwongella immobilis]|uniref:DUF1552 domain-containing protein n=1 Tax=Tuwongella immobilis TaxID=692036 RepID=A0A6C2YMU3_9BACT|nr:DUF1552 domain-containing protein [Tuwongella immobilis]VIP02232.1 Uncharacterized protein OS=Pirellula staleyi (strain ATCC 27377 / DSM 6068 / ICPB 4128) GN=Psta_0305 PE=4 SV=1: HXXSHH [Tuwongella immobilis]VTS00783.1 Uncharacterized protein OS=Pirellula staleyi (strain ATCC 27377 / DSM 6068 / ICPB 4128) GN=Psta_0305 PE=4 SV=1: HXXSHH [Tuwongella immobilis]